jgi:hypothetical protein
MSLKGAESERAAVILSHFREKASGAVVRIRGGGAW